jgi:hypothetical protein
VRGGDEESAEIRYTGPIIEELTATLSLHTLWEQGAEMSVTNRALACLVLLLSLGLPAAGLGQKDSGTEIPGKPAASYDTVDFSAGFEFPGDWDAVPVTELVAFYPGQTSWQFLTDPAHLGAEGVANGQSCQSCHAGDERGLGERLVGVGRLEDNPIPGKDPSKVLRLQAAYDEQRIYLRAAWASDRPGITHDSYRFDGERWVRNTRARPDPLGENELYSYEDRFAVIVDDRNLPAHEGAKAGFAEAGCFMTCHSSMREMPLEPSGDEVRAHPYLGGEKGRSDVRKYLLITREREASHAEDGAWDRVVSRELLERQIGQGLFLDLWQFRGARSAPVFKASDDYVHEYRWADMEGTEPWFDQDPDPDGRFEASRDWMYDKSITGFSAMPQAKLEEWIGKYPLITEGQGRNAVRYDPEAGFKQGDLLPRRLLREAEGSRGDVDAYGVWREGTWTVVLVRDLDTGNPDDKALREGGVYNVAFGIFDDHVSNRRHHVTFASTLGIGVEADITAVPIKGQGVVRRR